MKASIKILTLLIIAGGLTFTSCKKNDTAPAISLASITSGITDLNGAVPATGVTISDNIIVVLSTNVDAATATTANITLMRGSVSVPIAITVSGSTITIDPTDNLLTGTTYTLSLNNLKSDQAQSLAAISVSFTTAGVGLDTPPQKDSQVMYLQLNGDVTDITGNATASFQQVGFTTDRFGTANGAASFAGAATPGTGDIVELTGSTFINPSTTISVWFQVDPANYASGSKIMFGIATERGYFMELSAFDGWMKLATSHKVNPDPNSHYFGTAWTDPNGSGTHAGALAEYTGSIKDFLGTTWHQLTMTYDASTEIKTIYVDDIIMLEVSLANPPEWSLTDLAIANQADGTGAVVGGIDPVLTLGFLCSRANTATGWSDYSTATNTFKGALDDMRIWNKALTASEVATLYTSEKP